MPGYLSQPANGQALLGHGNICVVARSPCQVCEQDAQDSSAGSRADGSHRFVSGEGGADEGLRGSYLVNDGQELTVVI